MASLQKVSERLLYDVVVGAAIVPNNLRTSTHSPVVSVLSNFAMGQSTILQHWFLYCSQLLLFNLLLFIRLCFVVPFLTVAVYLIVDILVTKYVVLKA